MKLFFIIISLVSSFNLLAGDLTFNELGKQVTTWDLAQIKSGVVKGKHGDVKASEVKLFNVFRGYERTYEGYDLHSVLASVYGKNWIKKKRIVFTASDGYQQATEIKLITPKGTEKRGQIAFKEKGSDGFSTFLKNEKQIDPGPLYLVWTNFSEADKANHGDRHKWTYKLVAINIE